MLKLKVVVTSWNEYDDNGDSIKELDTAKITTVETIVKESELCNSLDSEALTAYTSATDHFEVKCLCDWVEDDESDFEDAYSTLEDDEIYVITRFGGGKVLKVAHGSYSYNHEYLDGGISEPCDDAETLITWTRY